MTRTIAAAQQNKGSISIPLGTLWGDTEGQLDRHGGDDHLDREQQGDRPDEQPDDQGSTAEKLEQRHEPGKEQRGREAQVRVSIPSTPGVFWILLYP